MKRQRNFDRGAGFSPPVVSDRFAIAPSRRQPAINGLGTARGLGGLMTTAAMSKVEEVSGLPDMKVSVRQVFGIDSDLEVPAYSEAEDHVPDLDPDYIFDREPTLAI